MATSNVALSVPVAYQRGFRELADLTEEQFSSLASAFSAKKPTLFSSNIELLSSPVENIEEQIVREIVDSFVSLAFGAMELIDKSPAETAASVASQIDSDDGKPLSDEARASISKRVESIVQIAPFRVSVRALSLALANGRNFVSGRIVTDLRPVFESSQSVDLATLVVLHRLQIQCTSGENRFEEIIFTLDSNDLEALSDQLNRAVEKESVLRKHLESSGLNFLSAKASTTT